jgi:hypothetical protein
VHLGVVAANALAEITAVEMANIGKRRIDNLQVQGSDTTMMKKITKAGSTKSHRGGNGSSRSFF